MASLPLIAHPVNAVFAFQAGKQISTTMFLNDVAQLAQTLPQRQHILNLCSDRYRFAVVFAAALLRNQVSLLPPNLTPGLIEQLRAEYTGLYCVTDDSSTHDILDTVFYASASGENAEIVPVIPVIPAAQLAAIVFTSGSTGQPLPHVKSWGGLVKGARASAERFRILPGTTILGTVPTQHMYGLESTVLLEMQNGLTLHAGRPFYPADICTELEQLSRPRGLVTTPVHLRSLLAGVEALPAIDFLLCATAPLSVELAAEAEARLATPLYEIYGCTEAGQVASRRTVDGAEWRVFRDVELRQDEHGTWVKGGHVEREILLNDVIELFGSEIFLLHSRSADLVNIAGKRTSLAHLNYHLNAIEGVRDGVFMMPEETGDVTRLMAFVVAPGLTGEAILQALRQRVDAIFLPRPLYLVDSLPRNAMGKLPCEAMRQLQAELKGKPANAG